MHYAPAFQRIRSLRTADHGVVPVRGAGPQAQRFIDYLLSPGAQAILVRCGFAPP